MQTTIYATYSSPENANHAFVELLQRGANFFDLILLTRRSYQSTGSLTDDGRLDVPTRGPIELEHTSDVPLGIDTDMYPAEYRHPFSDGPGGIRLLDNLRQPGDLAACLRELGFHDEIARNIETTVLDGGAMLISRTPSGPVEDLQAWEALERCGGTILSPAQTNPYLG